MNILIKGMEFPKEVHIFVCIHADGKVYKESTEYAGVWSEVATAVPAADVVECKRGTWQKRMETSSGNGYKSYTPIWSCSNCGKDYDPAICSDINFCYNCGADMREES